MALEINKYDFIGKVLGKSKQVVIKEDMKRSYLYVRGKYLVNGKEREQDSRMTCFSWGDNKSRITDVFPGDKVTFSFTLSGRYDEERRDKDGNAVCWTECVLSSKVEILSTEERKMYSNGLDSPEMPKDDLGTFDENDIPF